MTYSAELLLAVAITVLAITALIVVGVSHCRALDLLRQIADTHARSGERHSILQNRFLERMYEKNSASTPGAAAAVAQLHSHESRAALRDEIAGATPDGAINRQLALEAAKLRYEREHPIPDVTTHMDLGV